ncbi:hypothetical protein FQR65_LT13899 [Abscondita terminalis]|nr:hypothetical protein FQR65_LT13899 [Abscondita terminalis]
MKIHLLVLSLICIYVSGAPNLFENIKLQSGQDPNLQEQPSEVINPQKPLPLLLRDTVTDSKRKRCESCRKLKRCKVYQKCDICNVVCKDVDISQLNTSETALVGDARNETATDNDNSSVISNSSSSNSDRFYTIDKIEPGPKHDILARLLNIPKKDGLGNLVILEQPKEERKTNESPVIIDTANVFNKSEESELNADIIPVDNDNNQVRPELRTKIEKEVNMAVEEKQRLLNDSKLSKDELGQIVKHAKILANRKSNREGLLNLRSRSILNKENNDTNQASDSSKERPLLGSRLLTNRKNSIGFRRKINSTSAEKSADSSDNEQQPVDVKLPIMQLLTTTEHTIDKMKQQDNGDDVLQLKPQEFSVSRLRKDDDHIPHNTNNVLTFDKFIMLLKNLENKVEDIADLVRKTCRQPTTMGSTSFEPTSTAPFLNKKPSEIPSDVDEIDESPTQKGQNKFDKLRSRLDDMISNDQPEDQLNNDEAVSAPKDGEQALSNPLSVERTSTDDTINLPTDASKFDPDAEQIDEHPPIVQNSLVTNDKIIPDEEDNTSFGDSNEDTTDSGPNKLFNVGSRSAEEPFYKHGHFIQDPELENPFSNRYAPHAKPHNFLKPGPLFNQIKNPINEDDPSNVRDHDDSKNDKDELKTSTPSLQQRFAENVGDSKDNMLPVAPKEVERDDEEIRPDANNQLGVIGKLIPQDPKASDKVMFVSNGMRLPFNIKKNSDGSYQVSVDTEKLCPSCNNHMCKSTNDDDQTQSHFRKPKSAHVISKRNAHTNTFSPDASGNLHKKRKPFPPEKKKTTKEKRSINLESKDFANYKFINNFLNNKIESQKNKISFDKNDEGRNSLEKENVDVKLQRIDLLQNVLTWWKALIQDQA